MNAVHPETTCNDMITAAINKTFDINQIRKGFDHCGFETLRSTAKIHNLEVFGNSDVFEDFAISKAKQKSFSKVWLGSINIPGERIYINVCLI
jgi:hypothetical protein